MGQGSKGQRQAKAVKEKRGFGSIRQSRSGRLEARYTGPDGQVHTAGQTFKTRQLAERFLALMQTEMDCGAWVDPSRSRVAFSEWAEDWLATTAHLKPKTRARYETSLRNQVLPAFGHLEVGRIDHAAVRKWVAEMVATGAGAGTVAAAFGVARQILSLAMASGAIRANPTDGVRQPRPKRTEMHFLTAAQVEDLAQAITNPPKRGGGGEHRREDYPEYGLLVRTAAYTGLRAGELEALRVGRVDLLRRALEVAESLSEVGGELIFGEPKTYEHRRVPLPTALNEALSIALAGKSAKDLVFTGPNGGPLRHGNFYARHFKPATARIGVPELRFHDLRHTYAGLLIGQGAHPRAMMERLGHSSITVTLDRYGHLLPGLEEAVTSGLDDTYRKASPSPTAPVVPIPSGAHLARNETRNGSQA